MCALSPGLCVSLYVYVCAQVCALFSSCAFSRTCTQPNMQSAKRELIGSGPAGIEVGVSIDKAVNEVIGRINRGPKGTMSISACWSVSLSKDAGMGVRGDRVQWE